MTAKAMPTADEFQAQAAVIVPTVTGADLDKLVIDCFDIYNQTSHGGLPCHSPAEHMSFAIERFDLLSTDAEREAMGIKLYQLFPPINWRDVPVEDEVTASLREIPVEEMPEFLRQLLGSPLTPKKKPWYKRVNWVAIGIELTFGVLMLLVGIGVGAIIWK